MCFVFLSIRVGKILELARNYITAQQYSTELQIYAAKIILASIFVVE